MSKVLMPRTRPQDYGFKVGDYHLVANAASGTVKAYEFSGKLLWERPILLQGQHDQYWAVGGDTPPGVWYLGQLHNDKANGTMDKAFGWMFFDMVDLEGREDGNNRAGLGVHGGGSSLRDPFAPRQPLVPTLGCPRMHNEDLEKYVLPLYQKGKVFLSVYQLG
jgi:hypothetical protein